MQVTRCLCQIIWYLKKNPEKIGLISGWLYPEMIENLYGNDDDLEISIGSSLPDIELDEDVNYLREKQRKRWESSQIMEIVNLTQPYYSRLENALLAIFKKYFENCTYMYSVKNLY